MTDSTTPGFPPHQPFGDQQYAPQPPYAQPQPYGQPQPYPQQAPAYQPVPTTPAPYALAPYTLNGPAYMTVQRQNPLALASMIVSIVSVVTWLPALAGVIMGHIALRQIRRNGDSGRGMAIAGVVVGYAVLGFMVLYFGFIAVMIAIAATSSMS